MDKALEIGKTSATGSFHLLIGVAGSTIIMAIGTLILAGLLPVNEVGLYGIALIPSSIINFFRDWGVNYAMTQQIASLRDAGKDSEIHDVILSGIIFEIITGVTLSLICFVVAEPLALILSPGNAANLSVYISIMSLSIFAGAILAAAGGIFVGFERMKLNSFTQILQAIVKTALGPFLIVLGFGVLGAVYAAMSSILAGSVVAILIVYFSLFRPLRKCKVGKCDVKQTLKPMLKYGLPLTVSSIVIGVVPQVFAFTMAVYAGDWMMGNYYAAAYFSVLLTFISFPVATALFPVFSKLNPEKEPELVKTVFASSVKYTAVLLVPATMILITLSTPLINTLFPKDGLLASLFVVNAEPKFPYAPLFLALSSIVNLLVLVGNISLGTFQTGIGKTNQVMKQSILSLAVGLPIAYLLVSYFYSIGGPSFAVIGGIVGTLIATTPNVAWGLYWSWKKYRVKADFRVSAKIFAASAIASLVTYLFINIFSLAYWITLVTGFVVFSVVYLAGAPLLGAVNQADIDNFKTMFSSLGAISKILDVPLLFMRKMCKVNNAKKILAKNN
jgi:O-antigen/teichoic acid export membrane protein